MKKAVLYFTGGIAVLITAMSFSFKETPKTTVHIAIKHMVANQLLVLDSGRYTNELQQAYTLSKLKYYLGKFTLLNSNGTESKVDAYFLVDEENSESKTLQLDGIALGEYTGMEFILGVDSLNNCSGAQSGALDPVNAMFWTWNTGYIFLKLEGHAAASTSPAHLFEYHIGGYKQPQNSVRHFRFKFKKPLIVSSNQKNILQLVADVSEILKTPNTIDFSKLSSVTDLKNANTIADNYADMFTVTAPLQ
ncbi:MAG: hypothetical protein IT236_19225 [Bacteroidia bacterium]|nr:hypothetical protein [Bacteroidia bacterium]